MNMVRSFVLFVSIVICSTSWVECAPTPSKGKQTVCLNMIVKDESKIICRCLESALSLIDYWVIVDTGSSDGTQEVIKRYMKQKGVPGELHERPWKDFAHNRNEALNLAAGKADYVLFIDADDCFEIDPTFKMPKLDKTFYYIPIQLPGLLYPRIQLIKNQKIWNWVGVRHEVLPPPPGATHATLDGVKIACTRDGARSQDTKKYEKDAEALEKALLDEPNNTRYMFYLAQSYRDACQLEKSLEAYQQRVAAGGWDEELFWSKLQIAILTQSLNMEPNLIVQRYKEAYQYRPVRSEPLYFLANYYRMRGNYEMCYKIAKLGINMPMPTDSLFVQPWVYSYSLQLELSIAAYWIGQYDECREISLNLLKQKDLPQNVRECVWRNLGFANSKLIEAVLPGNGLAPAG